MDNSDLMDHAYITKRLTKGQRIIRATIPALGALLIAAGALVSGREDRKWIAGGFWFFVFAWYAWKQWKISKQKKLSTVRVPPTQTKQILGYAGSTVFFLAGIALALFGGAGWGFAAMLWILCALWAIQFLVPKSVLTPTALAEEARIEEAKLRPPPPPIPGSMQEKLSNLIEGFGELVALLIGVILVVGIIALPFFFAPWWAAVIILLLLLLLFK